MIEKYKDDEDKLSFLQERYSLLENLENDDFTVSNSYFFVVIAKNENVLKKRIKLLD